MSKDLKARVRLDTKQAEKALTRMEKKLNRINAVANRTASRGFGSVSKSVSNTNKNLAKTVSLTDVWAKKLNRVMSAYLGIQGLQATVNASDMITSAENRLNNTNASHLQNSGQSGTNDFTGGYSNKVLHETQQQMDKMYASSQKVRMGYADMMQNVSKSITLAGDAFQNNVDNAIRFQEIMAEAYAIGGASAAEQSSSMYQMIQGLGSGILQGDELRSVREGAPLAYKAIEEFAQKVLETDESLKKLASDGRITSDIVVAAMMEAGAGMDAAFGRTQMTFTQAWTKMKNTAIKSFEPVLQMLNKTLNSDAGKAIINGIGVALQIVGRVLLTVFTIIGSIYNFISDNWGWISKILLTAAAILGGVLLGALILNLMTIGGLISQFFYAGAVAVASALKAAWGWLTLSIPLTIIIAILAIIVITLIWVSDSFADACGYIVGAVFWLGATIWNIIVGVLNAVIQFVWTNFAEPWLGIVEWILNVMNGGFNSFGDAVKNLLGNIISWFLSLGKVVTKIIDAIFGTDWTSGLNNLQDSVLKWGKNEQAITISREAPEIKRLSATNAFDKGYDLGYQGGEWITDKVSGLGNLLTGGTLPNTDLFGLGGSYDPAKALDSIDDNTGSMADSMELTAEDLSYLRRVAEMEWKKEFTTAAITVDMSNYNTINGDNDLDGIVTKLADKLYEELHVVAEGVY